MADVNKSVEISYRADIKQLTKVLKQGGKLSEKQIKEMIGGLNKQLRQTEKAAQKAGTVASKSMKKIEVSARKAAVEVDELHGSAGDVGTIMGQIGGAVGLVNPKLEDMARAASDVVGGLESVAGVVRFINPAFVTFAVVAGLAGMAAMDYAEKAEAAEEAAQKLKEEQEELNKKLDEYRRIQNDTIGNLGAFTAELNMARAEVAMLNGEISKAEFESASRQIKAAKLAENLRATQQKRLDALMGEQNVKERMLAIEKTTLENMIKNRKGSEGLTAEMAKRAEQKNKIAQLEKELEDFAVNRKFLEEQVAQDYEKQTLELVNLQAKAEELEETQRAADQRRTKRRQERKQEEAKAAQEAIKRQQELMHVINSTHAQQEQALLQIQSMTAKRAGQEQSITTDYNHQIHALNKQSEELKRQLEFQKSNVKTSADQAIFNQLEIETQQALLEIEELKKQKRIEAIEAIEKLREEKHKSEMARIDKENANYMRNYDEMTKAITGFADASITLGQNIYKNDVEAQHKLFKISQGAAVANIAFEASKAIASKLGLPPGVRGAAIAAIVAGAAAQTSTVLAQSPPTADMGGMIGNNDRLRPDETMVRVLRGEAILDRATTDRLGGQEGIQRLQEGSTAGQVVVVQPFKHFDRFIKQSTRAGRINYTSQQTRY